MSLPEAVAASPSSTLQRKPTARFGVAALAAAGLGLALWLIAETGFTEVGAAFSHAGWGLLLIVLSDLAGLCFAGLAWHALLRGFWNGPVGLFIRTRWLREAINTLLPVAQIGGDLVGARLLASRGPPASLAAAGVIADKTVEILGQFVFTVAGFMLLLGRGSGGDLDWGIGVGLVVAGPLLLGFFALQNSRFFAGFERLLVGLARRLEWDGLGRIAGLHATIVALYGQPRRLAAAFTFHMTAWVAGAGEVWLVLTLMGHPVSFGDAVILESLGQAARSAAFVIPGGFGAQEGAFLLIGGALGLPAEFALALSLIKRASQVLFGVPMLIAWPFLERRRTA